MSNEMKKETAIQNEQQFESTEKIIKELQQMNKNLEDLVNAAWPLSDVYFPPLRN